MTKVISPIHQLPIPTLMQYLLILTVPKELGRDIFPCVTLLCLVQCKSVRVSTVFFQLLPERCLCANIQKQKPIPSSTVPSADADGTLILAVFLSGVGRVITARCSTQHGGFKPPGYSH